MANAHCSPPALGASQAVRSQLEAAQIALGDATAKVSAEIGAGRPGKAADQRDAQSGIPDGHTVRMNIVGGHVLRHAEAHHSAGRPAYLSSMKAPQILRATQIVPCFTFAMKQAKGSRQKSRPLPAVLHLRIALSIRRASPVGWIFSSALEPRSPVNCRRHWGAGHRPPTDGAQGFRMSPVDDVRSAASYRSLSAPVSKTPAHRAPLRNLMEHRLLRVVPCRSEEH